MNGKAKSSFYLHSSNVLRKNGMNGEPSAVGKSGVRCPWEKYEDTTRLF